MPLFSWLHQVAVKWFPGRQNRRNVKLCVEQLEDRLAPAAFYLLPAFGNGANPQAGLIADAGGNLYGTTSNGGSAGLGTVFELVKSGTGYTPTILYSFKGGTSDGANPQAGLIMDSSGDLFGTTANGGRGTFGTVFELTKTSGGSYTESILHSFAGGSTDGATPLAGLIADSSGDLFGTTQQGGTSGFGTVFELVKSGSSGPARDGPFRRLDRAGPPHASRCTDGPDARHRSAAHSSARCRLRGGPVSALAQPPSSNKTLPQSVAKLTA